MINLYTIGFSKKTAKDFFNILKDAEIRKIIDVRRNNVSQLAGFTKKKDLEYFLQIHNIEYTHNLDFAPTQEILKDYQKKIISWEQYEVRYTDLIVKNKSISQHSHSYFNQSCLLCSESTPEYCHRRILAELIKINSKFTNEVNILHL